MDTTREYVQRLEAHLQMMSRRMEDLQAELSAATERNRALERGRTETSQRNADAEREAMQRAEAIVTEAERRVSEMIAEAQRRAHEVEAHAHQRAEEMIASVNMQLDQLEQEASELQQGRPPQGSSGSGGADAEAATERDALRAQVNDLLRLRESILLNMRAAIEGFTAHLAELESAPLIPEAQAGPEDAPGTLPTAARPGAPSVEVLAEPVNDFERASSLEVELAELDGAAEVRLRSLEGGVAALQVRGIERNRLQATLAARFEDATLEPAADGALRLRLAAGGPAGSDA